MQLRLAPSRAATVVAALAVSFAALPVVAGGAPAVASAGACSPGTGVTIVVDRNPGDGAEGAKYCASGSGRTAKAAMEAAGVPVEEVSSEPGFVCKIQGYPAEQSCQQTPPASAFWKLYWSNGTSASWNVSSYGYASLRVPTGGSVGWAYQGGGSGAPDGSPSTKPSPSPSKPAGGSGGSTKPSPSPSQPSATPSTSAPAPSASASTAPSASASAAEQAGPKVREKAAREKKADTKGEKKSDRKKDDDAPAKQRGAGRDEPTDLLEPSEGETVTSGELATPVSADAAGMTGSDLALLGVAGVCIAGLAASALVMARRRRS
ncbi:hypothetical protein G7072_05225 [Nocardioides sp. HDW12B]|uniref:hypothetical protein n=1 Tax=Nocardioides sp. HDW12B TaxID=2714939 RepID=UPI0014079256|nr:hypothetical protein [Nocardioides sp. HDW12B]QIK65813.1 hypothetical protein G7072_05225 [Nocardioides sp. HDW12B]